MSVSVYSSIDALSMEDADLLSYRTQRNLFSSIEWFRCLSQHASRTNLAPRIYVVTNDKDRAQRCYLFCYWEHKNRRILSMSNFYTMEFSPIFSSGNCDRASLLNELVKSISGDSPACRCFNLKFLWEDERTTEIILQSLKTSRYLTNKFFQFENYYTDTAGLSFSDYYAARPSRVKNTIKRKRRKLEQLHNVSFRIFSEYNDRTVDDYIEVYSRSWKDAEEHPDFIRELCRTAGRLSLLRMGLLYIDKNAVAAQIWLLSGRKAIIYKLAYDEAVKEYSVGSILTKEMAQFVLQNDRVEEIDYGVGSESYKQEWMDKKRILVGIEAFNKRTFVGNMMALVWKSGHFVKKRL